MLRALGLERYNGSKLKPHLKMSEQRLGILISKKTNLIKQQKREISELLKNGKEEKARIRVEALIRSDFMIEAYELIALLCELVHERIALINAEKKCPPDMKEAICTLIWSANRCQVPELTEVARQFELKYGPEFFQMASTDTEECVNSRVVHKLGISPPSALIVIKYLVAIADEYKVDWTPADTGLDDAALANQAMPGPSGFSVNIAPGSNLQSAYQTPSHLSSAQEENQEPLQVAQIIDIEEPPVATPEIVRQEPKIPNNQAEHSFDPTTHDEHTKTKQFTAADTATKNHHLVRSDQDENDPPQDSHFYIPTAPGNYSTANEYPTAPPADQSDFDGSSHDQAQSPPPSSSDYDSLAKRFESLKK